jgi:Na+(H+)/acetate symporter ActP
MNGITIGIFAAILALTLAITAWAAQRTRTATDFYAAGKGLTAAQNGFALAGDWCSAAAHFVGQDAIRAADRGGNLTLPLLAQYLGGGKGSAGGEIMLGFIAAVAVATIIAVVAGLTLACNVVIVEGRRKCSLAIIAMPSLHRRRVRPAHIGSA